MTMDLTCLYSTVKNISGKAKIFGFLPPHGRRLLDDEEFTVFGDVRQAVASGQRGGRAESRRDILAFEAAINRGDLTILHTCAPILQNPNSGDPKMVVINDSNVLALADPCWLSSQSGDPTDGDV
jgi:hypothetical protein